MAELVIPILFSGLIVFVPNNQPHAEFIDAYLLKSDAHCKHAPQISIIGCFDVETNLRNCFHGLQNEIDCSLADDDIEISPSPKQTLKYLGSLPSHPLPKDLGDGENKSWIVRLSTIGDTFRAAKGWNDGEDLVSGRIRFGWNEASVCELDEGGESKVHSFEFCQLKDTSPDCSNKSTPQAIAESLMFKASVPVGPIRISIFDRKDRTKVTTVKLNCPSGRCPLVKINNDINDKDCEKENIDYGFHFQQFYSFTKDEGRDGVFIPHRLSDDPVSASEVSNACGVKQYLQELSKTCPEFPGPKPDSRAICPPVIIYP